MKLEGRVVVSSGYSHRACATPSSPWSRKKMTPACLTSYWGASLRADFVPVPQEHIGVEATPVMEFHATA